MQTLPPSVSNNYINVSGVIAAGAVFFICTHFGVSPVTVGFLLCTAYAVTVLLLEAVFLKTYKRPSTGLDWNRRDYSVKRTAIKCLGLYGTFAALGIIYYVSPEYHHTYYHPFWQGVRVVLPVIAVLAIPYIAFVDARMREPNDGLYGFGLFLLGRWNEAEYDSVIQHVLAWMVKGFFLPLMYTGLIGNMDMLQKAILANGSINFLSIFNIALPVMYLLDIMIGLVGYSITFRLLDTHARRTDASWLGWGVCIVCYGSVFWIMWDHYPEQHDGGTWMIWLTNYPILTILWGSMILLLTLLYVFSSVNFGCRVSNLTYRGIITNGLFRYTKHPAYITKNISWWMMNVPLIPVYNWKASLSYTCFLLAVNGIYLLRARTEERLLSGDPVYVAYATYINEHGIFRWVGKIIPWLRYRPPSTFSQ